MAKKRKSRNVAKKASSSKRKMYIVVTNLILFAVLSLICFFLYNVSTNPFYLNLFFLLTLVLGLVGIAFFIALLVLIILKSFKK